MTYKERKIQLNKYIENGGSVKFAPPKPEDYSYREIFGYRGEAPKDWRPFAPEFEDQFSSYFCSNFSYTNCLETMGNAKGAKVNLSDRHSAKISETKLTGNYLEKVAHTAYKQGLVSEETCPFEDKWLKNQRLYWNDIMNVNIPADAKVYKCPNYSSVRTSLKYLKQALAYSPLYAGAMVGRGWENKVARPPRKGELAGGHAFEILHIDDYIHIQDSLGKSRKKLPLSYPIMIAKSLRALPDGWVKKKMKTPLKRAIGTKKVYAIINERKYWIVKWQNLEDFLGRFGYANIKEAQDAVIEVKEEHLNNYASRGVIGNPSLLDVLFGGGITK